MEEISILVFLDFNCGRKTLVPKRVANFNPCFLGF